MLVEAAAQMFSREGVSATTNRIAERAGLSVGTLYQYFPDKDALLRAVAERHVADATRRLDAEFDRLRVEVPPFDETIRALLEVIVDVHRVMTERGFDTRQLVDLVTALTVVSTSSRNRPIPGSSMGK